MCDMAATMLSAEGDLSVDTAMSGEVALERMAGANYDAVISDYSMPGMNGIDLLREARSRGFNNTFVIFTARGNEDIALDAILNGADHYLPKTAKASQDMALIRSMLQKRQRQAMEDREKRNEASYRSLVQRIREGFAYHRMVYDDTGRAVGSMVVDMNEAFEAIIEQPREAILGRDLREFVPDVEGYEHRLLEAFQEVMSTGREVRFEEYSRLTGRWFSMIMYVPEPGHFVTILDDVTAQRATEQEAQRGMASYLRLLDDLPNPVWLVSPEDDSVYFNRAWSELTGQVSEGDKDVEWAAKLHPDERERAIRDFREALSSRKPLIMEQRVMGADGGYHVLAVHGVPVSGVRSDRSGFLGVCFDLTEKRELERCVREGGSHYSAMFHGTGAVMLLVDGEDSTIVDANQAASEFYGYPKEVLIGKSINDISTGDASSIIRQIWMDHRNPEGLLHRRHRRASGEWRDVDIYLALVDVQGRTSVLDLVFDVTDRKVIEEALERERRDYEVVFNTTPTMIAIRDAEGRTVRCNRAFAERMGRTPDELVGMSIYNLMPAFAKQFHEEDLEVMRTGQARIGVESQYQVMSGEKRWGLVDKLPYKNAEGVNIGVIVFTLDITRRKLMEEELDLARKKLRLLGSITRHDLFNQITAINGYLGIAQMKSDSQLIKDYLAKAMRVSEGMSKILDFSRDYEKMGSQRPEWCRAQEAAVKGIADTEVGDTKVVVDLQGLELWADRMIQKAFHNLTDNSIRHGKATTVRFSYERFGEDLKIVCEDDGRGVPQEKRAGLFDDRFGHGLYMVKEVLRMTGLDITEVPVQKGTRFEILVPKDKYRLDQLRS